MTWEEILNTIGVRRAEGFRLVKPVLRDLSKKFTEGEEPLTDQEMRKLKGEVWRSSSPFSDENDRPFVLYIYDRNIGYGSAQRKWNYKFHFKWCSVLDEMDKKGRRARYKGKHDIWNPSFGSSNGGRERLGVCKVCLREFTFKGRTPHVGSFNLKEFFETYGLQNLKKPTHQIYRGCYTEDWQRIAVERKESANWVCEKCGEDFSEQKSLLHAHHINGVKDDNRMKNLAVLCYRCHGKQPGHENFRVYSNGKTAAYSR